MQFPHIRAFCDTTVSFAKCIIIIQRLCAADMAAAAAAAAARVLIPGSVSVSINISNSAVDALIDQRHVYFGRHLVVQLFTVLLSLRSFVRRRVNGLRGDLYKLGLKNRA
jgi:hypothetical protein